MSRHSLRLVTEPKPFDGFLDALDDLVVESAVARTVYRALSEPTSTPKQNALVVRGDEAVLATTLRARGNGWEVATSTVAPHLEIPHRSGMLEECFGVLPDDVLIPEYFFDAARDFPGADILPFDVYVAPLRGFDLEGYWRSTGVLRSLRSTQKLSSDLVRFVNEKETLAWLVDCWEDSWRSSSSDEVGAADDLRRIWPVLLDERALLVVGLAGDDGVPVAATGNVVADLTTLGLVAARDRTATRRGSLGTRMIAETIFAAREAGFHNHDLGGYHEYKHALAPVGSVRATVTIRRDGRGGRLLSHVPAPLRSLVARTARRFR